MADRNARWPPSDRRRRGFRWSRPGVQASLPPGPPTAASSRWPPRGSRAPDAWCSWTARRGRRQEVTVPSGAPSGLSWLDARVARAQPAGCTARRPESAVPAAIPGRSAVAADQRSERLHGDQPEQRSPRSGHRPTRRAHGLLGRRRRRGHRNRRRRSACRVSVERLAWSGDRLLYGGVVGGRPAHPRVTPGEGTPEEVVLDAAHSAASPATAARSCSSRHPPTTRSKSL